MVIIRAPGRTEEKYHIEPLKLAILRKRSFVDACGYSMISKVRFNWKWECSICKTVQQRLSDGYKFSDKVEDEVKKNEKYCQRCSEVVSAFYEGWTDSAFELSSKFHSIAFRRILRKHTAR